MRVAVTGGSGFVGQAVCQALKECGHEVVILSSSLEGMREGIFIRKVDYHDKQSLQQALSDCQALINLVGILHQYGTQTFEWAHHALVRQLVHAVAAAGIKDYLHMSALGADKEGPSAYLKSKAAGEKAAFKLCHQYHIRMISFRPSIIFGQHDNFFNQFAKILKYVPVIPLVCPNAKFQPVAVEDVAGAFIWGLESSVGQTTYELGGPEIMSMHEVIKRVCRHYGWRRLIIPLPDVVSKIQGKLMGLLPKAPFTYDNYLSMQKPNITDHWPWPEMGITPKAVVIHDLWSK